jgi:fucose 4-O-acetylase-like acetyltransferase
MTHHGASVTQRIQWIDSAKGLGISLIVIGHVWSLSDPPLFYQWMFAFHVPLFFFISGLTLKPAAGPLAGVFAGKVRTLLVPYFVYALVGYLFYVAGYVAAGALGREIEQFDYGLWIPLFGILHGTLGDGYLVNSPLWFLPALFVTFLAGYLLNTYAGHHGLRVAIVLSVAAFGIWLGDRYRLPFGLLPAMIALLFFQAGYYFRRFAVSDRIPERAGSILLVLLFVVSLAAPLNGAVGIADMNVNQPLLFLAFAFNGILLSVLFVQRAGILSGMLALVGRHSLAILVLHMLVIKSVKVVLLVVFGVDFGTMEHSLLWGLVVLGVSALVLVPCIYVIDRWLPFTLGRFGTAPTQGRP